MEPTSRGRPASGAGAATQPASLSSCAGLGPPAGAAASAGPPSGPERALATGGGAPRADPPLACRAVEPYPPWPRPSWPAGGRRGTVRLLLATEPEKSLLPLVLSCPLWPDTSGHSSPRCPSAASPRCPSPPRGAAPEPPPTRARRRGRGVQATSGGCPRRGGKQPHRGRTPEPQCLTDNSLRVGGRLKELRGVVWEEALVSKFAQARKCDDVLWLEQPENASVAPCIIQKRYHK